MILIDPRNIRTSLYDSLIALYTENYSYLWPDKDKYDTRDKKQHNLQQLIKLPGPV